jgi:hypothetical protein
MNRTEGKIDVIFIGGMPRCGSTLLGNIIGSMEGHIHLGEVFYLWNDISKNNYLCSCGEVIQKCKLYSKVYDRLKENYGENRISGFGGLRNSWSSTYETVIDLILQKDLSRDQKRYTRALADVYRTAAEVSRSDVVVDSSKFLADASLLLRSPLFNVTVLHLVRDPRGVANSWMKKKERRDSIGENSESQLPVYSPLYTIFKWAQWNLSYEIASIMYEKFIQVKYENICLEPKREIKRIEKFYNKKTYEMKKNVRKVIKDGKAKIGSSHAVRGNPDKMEDGWINIKEDKSWKESTSGKIKKIVKISLLPLMKKYNYE